MQNTIYEFWLLILQNIREVNGQGTQKIAMLTEFIESSRQKCAVYFPPEIDDVVIFTSTSLAKDEGYIREKLDKVFDPGKCEEMDDTSEEFSSAAFYFFVVK